MLPTFESPLNDFSEFFLLFTRRKLFSSAVFSFLRIPGMSAIISKLGALRLRTAGSLLTTKFDPAAFPL